MAVGIEPHVPDLDGIAQRDHGCLRRGAAQHGPHAGDELAEPVRLGHVVVGTDLEADHRVDLTALRRDHDDRHLRAGPDLAAHVDARHLRQHHVEEDEVGSDRVEEIERLAAIPRDLHTEAFSPETDREGLDEGVFVFDH